MKKLLIATTALVGTAGVVAADVTFSGYGRFGIQYDENNSRTTITEASDGFELDTDTGLIEAITDGSSVSDLEETRLEARWRLNIDASTETDGGVRFAARVRMQADDQRDGSVGAVGISSPRFQVSAGGFRVRVGNISGVTDAAEVVNTFGFEPGLTGKTGHYATFGGQVLGAYDAFASSGQGPTGINVKYEVGDFAVMASWTDDFDADEKDGGLGVGDRETWEIGASYTFSGWTVGGMYGEGDYGDTGAVIGDGAGGIVSLDGFEYDWWILTATGSVGIADLAVFIGDTDVDTAFYDDSTAYGISGSVPVGASTNILASVAGGGEDALDTAWGLGFDHSLGGGVNLRGMFGEDAFGDGIADLGVIFNF